MARTNPGGARYFKLNSSAVLAASLNVFYMRAKRGQSQIYGTGIPVYICFLFFSKIRDHIKTYYNHYVFSVCALIGCWALEQAVGPIHIRIYLSSQCRESSPQESAAGLREGKIHMRIELTKESCYDTGRRGRAGGYFRSFLPRHSTSSCRRKQRLFERAYY